MLEVYTWTDTAIIREPHAIVHALEAFHWDGLADVKIPGSTFGFVVSGENALLRVRGRTYPVPKGTYFVCDPNEAELSNAGGRILLITQPLASFPFMVGGPVEDKGRLRYIDGCTDSLLIPPWRKGEACLNHLHIPAGTEQTMHTHPSDRIGVVLKGAGQCVTPEGVTDLRAGLIWRIPANGLHRFRTEGVGLDIVAWHPDSDFGPTDDAHPMLNRTYVDGVSATELHDIRTR